MTLVIAGNICIEGCLAEYDLCGLEAKERSTLVPAPVASSDISFVGSCNTARHPHSRDAGIAALCSVQGYPGHQVDMPGNLCSSAEICCVYSYVTGLELCIRYMFSKLFTRVQTDPDGLRYLQLFSP